MDSAVPDIKRGTLRRNKQMLLTGPHLWVNEEEDSGNLSESGFSAMVGWASEGKWFKRKRGERKGSFAKKGSREVG